ncbi:MAG: cytochrome c [Candidatus Lambdaproteobacteria bacterium]|nr:cytochrome c [Candidatus Lambdaproteobacteria bacterium]
MRSDSRILAEGAAAPPPSCANAVGHGDGAGAAVLSPRPPNLRGAVAGWSDGQIAARIKAGRGAMPAFGAAMGDEAIWGVVHYVRRLQGR